MKTWREAALVAHEETCKVEGKVEPWSETDTLGIANWLTHEAAELASVVTKNYYGSNNMKGEYKAMICEELGDVFQSLEQLLECLRRTTGMALTPEMLDHLALRSVRKLAARDAKVAALVGEGWEG